MEALKAKTGNDQVAIDHTAEEPEDVEVREVVGISNLTSKTSNQTLLPRKRLTILFKYENR